MVENAPENPGAFIIDGHGRADLGVVRALGESGVPVYLATDEPLNPASASRFVTRRFPFPPPGASDEEKVAAMVELGRGFRHKPVFFSTGDTSMRFFSRHRDALEQFFRHHIGDAELLETLADKRKFARFAQANGLPVPVSLAPDSREELEGELHRLTFPVMVKPNEKKNWDRHPEVHALVGGNLKGVRVDSELELLELYDALTPYDNRVVVQDYIEGRDEEIFSLHGYIDRQGEVKGWFTGQKLRTWPIHRGIGCFQLSVIEREVAEVALTTLCGIGYTGHAIVQVKRLPTGDGFHIMEINTRYSTWAYLHKRAGVNQEWVAYLDSLGRETEPLPEQTEGVRWIEGAADLRAFRAYRQIGEWSFIPWARSYIGRNCYAVFAWNDPMPWLRKKLRPLGAPLRLTRRVLGRRAG